MRYFDALGILVAIGVHVDVFEVERAGPRVWSKRDVARGWPISDVIWNRRG